MNLIENIRDAVNTRNLNFCLMFWAIHRECV